MALPARLERAVLLVPLLALAAAAGAGRRPPERAAAAPVLRVCSDPNNLPFSNARGEGFENKLASLVGSELGARVEYVWWAQRRGFIRNTLRAHECDVVMGVPTSFELALPTRPYYRSTYAFLYREGSRFAVRSLDDPRLKRARIGVQMIGDDYANTPPAHALANRGIVGNVRGFLVYGDYRQHDPQSPIVDAVARGDVDVAIAWGPTAGYYARREPTAIAVVPVSPQIDLPYLPFVFDISMGVRREDTALRDRLDEILDRRRASVDSILQAYGVPRADRQSS
ncbi:MAG TPA: substrate-binding domain-containing protein [Gemmatimonadaceae bacterium]|nr:substrate-binding domain-containing protein [Gemmatimonadaceae bacterium]